MTATETATRPKIQEVESSESHSEDTDEEVGEEGAGDMGGEGSSPHKGKFNRSEKKSRKAIQRLGMKPITGIVKVTIKKSKQILFVISNPDVYKSTASDTYIIFGEAKVEDFGAQAQTAAAAHFVNPPEIPTLMPVIEESGVAGGQVDDTGVDQEAIQIIMDQTKCSRSKAVEALRANKHDVVDAIMQITSGSTR